MTLRYLSGSNGFIPEATGQVISYSRKPDKFAINRYVQYVPAPKTVFEYAVLERDAFARVVTDAEFAWEDGDDRPTGKGNQLRWNWVETRTFRRDYPFTLGWLAQEQAGGGWKPLASHAAMVMQQAMTNRTRRIVQLLEASSNWSGNTADANVLSGGAGTWDQASDDPASPRYLAIKKAVLEAVRRIVLATNGMVTFKDLQLLLSPGLALAMGEAPEIQNYIRESPFAMAQMRGDVANINQQWGLPTQYAGLPITVEDAVIVTERPKASGTEASTNRTFIKADTSAAIISRPGALDGEYGSPSFSTLQCYHFGGLLKVMSFDDTKHERTEGHVEENFKEVLAAPQSGYLITGTK